MPTTKIFDMKAEADTSGDRKTHIKLQRCAQNKSNGPQANDRVLNQIETIFHSFDQERNSTDRRMFNGT